MRSFFLLLTAAACALNSVPCLASSPSFEEFDQRARNGESLSVVFFGGSLTWGANASDPQLTSYRPQLARKFEAAYPQAHFHFWDAAIGGTGSQLGIFRLERDVLSRKPDLVFLDFTVNDNPSLADEETLASYEAIVRQLVQNNAAVVQVLFPSKRDVTGDAPTARLRDAAHRKMSDAYHTGLADAVRLIWERVHGKAKVGELWPLETDTTHPGDRGYELYAEAAWDGYQQAIAERRICRAPPKMLHADWYTTAARVRLSSLGSPPAGWKVGTPNRISAYYDMLMSRWLDDELVARHEPGKPEPQPLRVKFRGHMVLLFGEGTPESAKYQVLLDGKPVTTKDSEAPTEFDAGSIAKPSHGNTQHVQLLASGLNPSAEHTLEIQPLFQSDRTEELRFESICVAGDHAEVVSTASKAD